MMQGEATIESFSELPSSTTTNTFLALFFFDPLAVSDVFVNCQGSDWRGESSRQ